MSACPICKKPAIQDVRPFCSKRCADVDLNRWLSDRYVVPGADEDEENPPSTGFAPDFAPDLERE